MPTAQGLFCPWDWILCGVGQSCPIPQHPFSPRKTGQKKAFAREGTGPTPGPSFLPQSLSTAPSFGLPVSPGMCGLRDRAVSKGRLRGCTMPGTVLLLLAYLAYLALGTAVFWALESPAAQNSSQSFQQEKWAMLRNFTCMDQPALDSLIRSIVQAYKSGAILLGNTTSMGRWELVGSFFFSVSTITTIGYGNLSPRTVAARLFCIFFALMGIPLNLVVLNRLAQLMQRGVHRCACRLGGTWQNPAKAWWLVGSGALLSGLLFFLLLPPLLFSHMEGWSYMESFYFAFITLSTVGFGDYVIGMNTNRWYPLWYKNMVSLWILFGMAWLALIIKLILSLLETPRKLCSCYHHDFKRDFKPRGWRQGPEGKPESPSSQQACHPEEPVEITPYPEPSTQATRHDKYS